MGGVSSSTAKNSLYQSSLNTISQQAEANCTANCTQIQSGNTVIIENSTVGDIQFIQECTVDATCQIENTLDATAKTIQDSLQRGEAQPGWFYTGVQINESRNKTVQEVRQDIEQRLQSACNATVSQVQTGNLIYAKNSQTGDIGFIQSADLRQNCYLDNSAKAVATTTQKSDQFAQAGGIGAGLIAAILLIVIAIIVIAVVFIIISRRRRQRKEERSQQYSTGGLGSSDLVEAERRAAASGLTTADYLRLQQGAAAPPPPPPIYYPPPAQAPVYYTAPPPSSGPFLAAPPPVPQPAEAGSGGVGSAIVTQAGEITQRVLADKELREATGRAIKKGGQQAVRAGKKYGGQAVQYGKTALSGETRAAVKGALSGGSRTTTKAATKAVTTGTTKAVTKTASTGAGKAVAKTTGQSIARTVIAFIPK